MRTLLRLNSCSAIVPCQALLSTYRHTATQVTENLHQEAMSELQKELWRDEGEGLKSVPPQVPAGWRINHEPRSRWLTLRRVHNPLSSSHTSSSAMQYKGHLNNATPMTVPNPRKGQNSRLDFWSKSIPTCSASPMDVEIHVPFATHDPSLYENSIDICEWQPIDVLCSKEKGTSAIMFHLAAANSQLRVRSIQLLTNSAARELGSAGGSLSVFGGYGPVADYQRTLAYQGPLFTALSSEMQACILDFIAHDVGMDDLLLEFILQTLYLGENSEYQKWLFDMGTFAAE